MYIYTYIYLVIIEDWIQLIVLMRQISQVDLVQILLFTAISKQGFFGFGLNALAICDIDQVFYNFILKFTKSTQFQC